MGGSRYMLSLIQNFLSETEPAKSSACLCLMYPLPIWDILIFIINDISLVLRCQKISKTWYFALFGYYINHNKVNNKSLLLSSLHLALNLWFHSLGSTKNELKKKNQFKSITTHQILMNCLPCPPLKKKKNCIQ